MFSIKPKNNKILIVAEACDNHFGSINNAKKMIIKAKEAGADIIKFQHHIPDEEMLINVPKSRNFKVSLYDFLKKNALKLKDHEYLLNYCKNKKIKYLCTPFSYKAACELNEIGVDFFKIGSGEFTDIPFIKKLCKFGKPIIFSTGMSTISDIDYMYNFLNKHKRNEVAFMNCTSEYPPELKDINLKFITKMKKKYPNFVIGHSDHTNQIYTSIAAAALGAKIIEKHVYLDRLNYGPDKDVSISFKQLKELTIAVRDLEKALGDKKNIYLKENQIQKWAKRSLVSIQDIKKGDKISTKNIWSKRPGTGIPSKYIDKYIGKISKYNIKKNTILKIFFFK